MLATDRERIRILDEVLHPKPKAAKTIPPSYKEPAEKAEFTFPESVVFEWNPDGTLKQVSGKDFEHTFIWGADGNLQRVIKR
jgi:hypothetical protein